MTPRGHGLRGVVLALGLTGLALTAQAASDAVRGEQVYARCMACHALAYDRPGTAACWGGAPAACRALTIRQP